MEFNKKNIVFGCWPISGDYGERKNNRSLILIKKAIDWGISEFDTAPNYGAGNSEKLLGQLDKKYKRKIMINTKIGNSPNNEKSFDVNFLKKNFEESLLRLKIKKINILFLHNPRNIKNLKEIVKFLNKLKKGGIIKKSGLSLANDYKYSKFFISKFDVLQYDFNLLCQKKYLEKFKFKKVIYKRSIFGSGTITEKFLKETKIKFNKTDHRSKWLNNKRANLIKYHLNKIKKITKENISLTSYTFVKKNLGKDKIILGFRTLNNLKEFLSIYHKDILENNYKKIKKYYNTFLIKYDKRPLV